MLHFSAVARITTGSFHSLALWSPNVDSFSPTTSNIASEHDYL